MSTRLPDDSVLVSDDAVLIGRLADEIRRAVGTLRVLRSTSEGPDYDSLSLAIRVLDEHSRDLGRQLGRVYRRDFPSTLREIEAQS